MSVRRTRDLNRFKKTYPIIRRRPVYDSYIDTGDDVTIEIGEIIFTDSQSESHNFTESFSDIPIVTVTVYNSEGNNMADVNTFIESVTVNSFTVSTSDLFTGKIHFHAIDI